MAKYKELDPTIIDWLKERAEEEQKARHNFNERKIKLLEKNSKRLFILDVFSIFSAFFIILAAMGLSYFLVYYKMKITGTIFAGSTIILAAIAFLNFGKKKRDDIYHE